MKLKVTFGKGGILESAIANAILETGITPNIERATIDGDNGMALLGVKDADADRFVAALKKQMVEDAEIQRHTIAHDESECVDCGLCISICPKQVFSFDEGWKLCVDSDKCVLCGLCEQFCPQRALSTKM